MSINVVLPLDTQSLGGRTIEDFRQSIERAVPKAMRTAARMTEKRLKDITPVSGRPWERAPGGLRDSLKVYESTNELRAVWDTPYAEYIDKGTPAHAVTGDMHWQPGPGVWGHSSGHMVRGIRPHNLTQQAEAIMQEEVMFALITLIAAESRGIAR